MNFRFMANTPRAYLTLTGFKPSCKKIQLSQLGFEDPAGIDVVPEQSSVIHVLSSASRTPFFELGIRYLVYRAAIGKSGYSRRESNHMRDCSIGLIILSDVPCTGSNAELSDNMNFD